MANSTLQQPTLNHVDLTTTASLVSLNISRWVATKHDKSISIEVANSHGSDSSMGRYNKRLIAKEAIAEVGRIASAARQEHYRRTLPWNDGGDRLLSHLAYYEYRQKMLEFKTQWEEAVDRFVSAYPSLVEEARQKLNGLFNPEEYPSVSEIRGKFSFEYELLPMPIAHGIRADILSIERESIEKRMNKRIELAVKDVYERIKDVVQHTYDRLSAYQKSSDGTKSPFRDTLITNIQDLVKLLPTLNVTDSAEIKALGSRLEKELATLDPDDLREDSDLRERTTEAAEKLLKDVSQFI